MGTLCIHPATRADAAAMARLTAEANAEYVGVYRVSGAADTPEDVCDDLHHGVGFVATRDGQPVGAVRCRLVDDGRTGYIKRLAVVPAARRQGVGRRLMAAAERHLQDAGARRVTLGTVAANAGLTAFYAALRYRPTGDTPVPDRGFDARGWEKSLI